MKRTALCTLLLLQMYCAHSQSVFSNATTSTLQKVLEEYPKNFRNIRGELLVSSNSVSDYRSTVSIPGSIRCFISQYGEQNSATFSWTCNLFESASFTEAEKRFRDLYKEIRNTIIRVEGQKPYILNGPYSTPGEEQKDHAVDLHLLPSTGDLQNVKVQLKMTRDANGWEISLFVSGQNEKMQSFANVTGE